VKKKTAIFDHEKHEKKLNRFCEPKRFKARPALLLSKPGRQTAFLAEKIAIRLRAFTSQPLTGAFKSEPGWRGQGCFAP
jgi:hypothetical protein